MKSPFDHKFGNSFSKENGGNIENIPILNP